MCCLERYLTIFPPLFQEFNILLGKLEKQPCCAELVCIQMILLPGLFEVNINNSNRLM